MRTQANTAMTLDSNGTRIGEGVRVCRECGRRIPHVEAQVGLDRLVRRFPGFSRDHAYCTACVRGLEVLLAVAIAEAAPAANAR